VKKKKKKKTRNYNSKTAPAQPRKKECESVHANCERSAIPVLTCEEIFDSFGVPFLLYLSLNVGANECIHNFISRPNSPSFITIASDFALSFPSLEELGYTQAKVLNFFLEFFSPLNQTKRFPLLIKLANNFNRLPRRKNDCLETWCEIFSSITSGEPILCNLKRNT
jgi:hypothetical protein